MIKIMKNTRSILISLLMKIEILFITSPDCKYFTIIIIYVILHNIKRIIYKSIKLYYNSNMIFFRRKLMVDIAGRIAEELGISLTQVNNVINLLDDGNTVPFISRYRKEQTGALSDEVLRKFQVQHFII